MNTINISDTDMNRCKISIGFQYTVDSLSRTRKGPTNLFEIEKNTVKIKIFTNKTREVNKGLLGMY